MQRILNSVATLSVIAGTWSGVLNVAAQESDTRDLRRHEDSSRGRTNDNPDRSYSNSDDSYRGSRRNDEGYPANNHEHRNTTSDRWRPNALYGDWNRENIQVSKLPEAVQKTIRQQGREVSVVRVDQETQRGKVNYRVQLRDQGQRRYMTVAADGTLLSARPSGPDYEGPEYTDYERARERDREWDRRQFDNRPPSTYDSHSERGYDRRNEVRDDYRNRNDYRYDGPPVYSRSDEREFRGRTDFRGDEREQNWQQRRYEERRYDDPASNRPADRQWSRERDYDRTYERPDYDRSDERNRPPSRDRNWSRDREDNRYESRSERGDYDPANIRISDLPPDVRQTINQHAGEQSIDRIERENNRGQVLYRIHTSGDHKKSYFRVRSDGEFVGAQSDNDGTSDKNPPELERGKAKAAPDASIRPGDNRAVEPKTDADKPVYIPNK